MRRVDGQELQELSPFFNEAAKVAQQATCLRAKCGSIVVQHGEIIGTGYNGPPLGDASRRTCETELDLSVKPKYDKTCCVHAEWRAVLDACKRAGKRVVGATLYFMRVDDSGNFTDAGDPFCTTCSRLTMEAGVAEFALWNNNGADVYPLAEYDAKSYAFYKLPTE